MRTGNRGVVGLRLVETSDTGAPLGACWNAIAVPIMLLIDTGVCPRSLLQHLGFEDMLPAVEPEPEAPAAEATAEDLDAAAAHLGTSLVDPANFKDIPSLMDCLPRCLWLYAARTSVSMEVRQRLVIRCFLGRCLINRCLHEWCPTQKRTYG